MKITEDVRKYAAEQGLAEERCAEEGNGRESRRSLSKKARRFTRAG